MYVVRCFYNEIFYQHLAKCPSMDNPDNGIFVTSDDEMTAYIICKPGYTVMGLPYATAKCINGKWQWDINPPLCTK